MVMHASAKVIESSRPFIPRADRDLGSWLDLFSRAVAADPAAVGLTRDEAAALRTQAGEFTACLQRATDPTTRNPQVIAEKNEARCEAISKFRAVAAQIKANSTIEEDVKLRLGIPVQHASTRPRFGAPTGAPVISFISAARDGYRLCYADPARPGSTAKPRGVLNLQLLVIISDQPETDPSQALLHGAYTRTPFIVSFDDVHRGKIATCFGRWATRTGLTGPFSAPLSMTILAQLEHAHHAEDQAA